MAVVCSLLLEVMKYSYVKQFFALLVIMGKNRVQLHVGVLPWIDIIL